MDKYNVIFPMAGRGSRFDYRFKPFIMISDLTFIQMAFSHFSKWKKDIRMIYFIFTEHQEREHNVRENISQMFSGYPHKTIILQDYTAGPYTTICKALSMQNIEGPSFICDCDHRIDIEPMLNPIRSGEYDIIIPTWNLKGENMSAWSKVYLDNDMKVISISEKETLDLGKEVMGMIGCIFFKDLSVFDPELDYENVSELIINLLHCKNVITQKIQYAEFFGDPDRLKSTINDRRMSKSIFCDIDGTIILHEANPRYDKNPILLDGTVEKMNEWKRSGMEIILTTSRSELNRERIVNMLEAHNIPYDKLICDLPSGQRIIINDMKPSLPFTPQAMAINVIRNDGINGVNISSHGINGFPVLDGIVLHVLKGGSFSNTVLMEGHDTARCEPPTPSFVRKYIIKRKDTITHYQKLRRQLYDIRRNNTFHKGICPKILGEFDSDIIYYFDMEYLEDYKTINLISKKAPIINKLTNILKEHMYCMQKKNMNPRWISDYVCKKIKLNEYEDLDDVLHSIINLDTIKINGLRCIGLKRLLAMDFNYLGPKFLTPIHGDLTFENILYHEGSSDLKLIDMDGGDHIDAPELDFGKLLQSQLSRYEMWSNSNNIVHKIDCKEGVLETAEFINVEEAKMLLDDMTVWKDILDEDDNNIFTKKGMFFLSLHLLRMIPYRYNVSLEQAVFALREAIVWLNQIISF